MLQVLGEKKNHFGREEEEDEYEEMYDSEGNPYDDEDEYDLGDAEFQQNYQDYDYGDDPLSNFGKTAIKMPIFDPNFIYSDHQLYSSQPSKANEQSNSKQAKTT